MHALYINAHITKYTHVYTDTHTHTHKYIYIYNNRVTLIYRNFTRERSRVYRVDNNTTTFLSVSFIIRYHHR